MKDEDGRGRKMGDRRVVGEYSKNDKRYTQARAWSIGGVYLSKLSWAGRASLLLSLSHALT